jgi:uncharacterized protein
MELEINLENKLYSLISFLKGKKIIVAFSGGVDSALLAFLSKNYAKDTLLVTEKSILYPNEEIDLTVKFAKKYNIPHKILERNPLNDIEFRLNPSNRCYLCKKGLYEDVLNLADTHEYEMILDGTNLDDLSDFRPGIKALQELNIKTPYIDFRINKKEIRQLSTYFDLEVSSKPSMACFSSRIPYHQDINQQKLYRIKSAESFLKKKFDLDQLRVRYHENKLARIEFLPQDIPKILNIDKLRMIKNYLKMLGFNYITIDLEGFRSGSMNEVLSKEVKSETI